MVGKGGRPLVMRMIVAAPPALLEGSREGGLRLGGASPVLRWPATAASRSGSARHCTTAPSLARPRTRAGVEKPPAGAELSTRLIRRSGPNAANATRWCNFEVLLKLDVGRARRSGLPEWMRRSLGLTLKDI